MRLLVLLLVVSAATTGFASSKKKIVDHAKLDPIVTGGTKIKKADRRAWEKQRDAARLCPKCAVSQPFPEGDLPITSVKLK